MPFFRCSLVATVVATLSLAAPAMAQEEEQHSTLTIGPAPP